MKQSGIVTDFIEFEGKKVYYETLGSGRPLLMIHGNTASSVLFNAEKLFYKDHFKVILFDWIGHGKSERVEGFRDDFWLYNARTALALLSHLQIDKCNLIGSSGGALVALNLALTAPGSIDKIIVESFLGEHFSADEAGRIAEIRKEEKKDFLMQKFWEAMHGEDWENIIDMDLELMLKVGGTIPMIRGDLSKITIPVLGVASTKDGLIPNIDERLKAIISKMPNASYKIFNEGRHVFTLTRNEIFRELALDFFNK
ncbi:MAG: alpha/beta fold hydrolase [Bacteroidota bacterium]